MRGERNEDFRRSIQSAADVKVQLARLDEMIETLRVQYEQFFVGVMPHAPDKLHNATKRLMRQIMKAPFKNSETNYKLRGLERRYQTYNTYWERVKRQREEGTYHRDVFKASMRQRHQAEDQQSSTRGGAAKKGMQDLFSSYKKALEKQTGKAQRLDFDAFKSQMVKRAKELKKQTGSEKMSFKVVVKNGKVSLKASVK